VSVAWTMPKTRAYSMSGLKNVDCLARYKAIVEDRVPESSGPALRGQVIHEAALLYIEALAAHQLTADAALAQDAIQGALASLAIPFEHQLDARAVFTRWIEGFTLDLEAFLCAEESQRERGFSWRPDLVYARPHELEIVDWKSHFAAYTGAEAQAHFQPRFYLWRAMQVWPGFPSYRFTYDFIRLGQQVSVVLTPADVQDVEDDVQAKIQLVDHARREGVWPPTMGPLCAYCALACPLVDDTRLRPVRSETIEDVRAVAVEMAALEAAYTSRLAVVKAWTDANGPLLAGGRRYAWVPKVERTYPAGVVLATMEAHGTPVPAALTFSASALGSVLTAKTHHDLAHDIGLHAVEKPGRRWSDTVSHESED